MNNYVDDRLIDFYAMTAVIVDYTFKMCF